MTGSSIIGPMMTTQILIDDVTVDVAYKDIRHMYLKLHFPTGNVRVSAPARMGENAIRSFVMDRIGWIRRRQQQMERGHVPNSSFEFGTCPRIFVCGEAYRLIIVEGPGRPAVRQETGQLLLKVKPGTGKAGQRTILDGWYRHQLQQGIPPLLEAWQGTMRVRIAQWGIKKMKTRWGTCNTVARRIWLNLELAKRSPRCLEFIVVHELAHLLERRHNARFRSIMDKFLPQWRQCKAELAAIPLVHEFC